MSLVRFYLSKGQVIIPTVARTEAGFYADMEPVAIVNIDDLKMVKESMLAVLSRENPQIPTPKHVQEPGSVILEALSIKRWEHFEKKAVLYTVHKGAESIVIYATGRGANGMWIEKAENNRCFSLETALEEIVDSVVADMLRQPESAPPPVLLLPPPPEM